MFISHELLKIYDHKIVQQLVSIKVLKFVKNILFFQFFSERFYVMNTIQKKFSWAQRKNKGYKCLDTAKHYTQCILHSPYNVSFNKKKLLKNVVKFRKLQ